MRRAAELGSADAQHDLGKLLSSGHGGFPKDEVEARGWQERAARAGHLQALVSIGRMCLRGEGGPSDPVEGLAWLEKAAATDISVFWTGAARDSLDEILTFIALDSPALASKIAEVMLGTAESLSLFAERGRVVPELDPRNAVDTPAWSVRFISASSFFSSTAVRGRAPRGT